MKTTRQVLSPSQTVGPFFHEGLKWEGGENLFPDPATPGRRITLTGLVTDGKGAIVHDAFLELWQPDGNGQWGRPVKGSCAGFGRVMTNAEGRYVANTMVPGALDAQAPHILVVLFARGLLHQLLTRVYFDGEPANAMDPVLAFAGPRAATLIARPDGKDAAGVDRYTWNIVLQGQGETVFFDC